MGEENIGGDVEQGRPIPQDGTDFPDAQSTGSGSMAFVGGLMEDNAARRLAGAPVTTGTGGAGGGFLVDPDRAQQAVDTRPTRSTLPAPVPMPGRHRRDPAPRVRQPWPRAPPGPAGTACR